MTAIFCRLIFHDFSDQRVEKFLQIVQASQLGYVTDINFQQPVPLDSDSSERNTEVQFSFQLKGPPEGRQLEKSEKYQRVCLALCELSKLFERLRRDFYSQGLSGSSTVTMTVLSKNIYPQYFELHNVFRMKKLVLGSIINRQAFAPTYFIDAPRDENDSHYVFAQYLDEQRDLQDVDADMLICFEHDRGSFTVCFPDILKNWTTTPEENTRSPKRVVDIRVEYSAIRRIIVSMENDDQNEFKVTFTFQLNYPPTIQIYEMFNSPGKTKTKFKPP